MLAGASPAARGHPFQRPSEAKGDPWDPRKVKLYTSKLGNGTKVYIRMIHRSRKRQNLAVLPRSKIMDQTTEDHKQMDFLHCFSIAWCFFHLTLFFSAKPGNLVSVIASIPRQCSQKLRHGPSRTKM